MPPNDQKVKPSREEDSRPYTNITNMDSPRDVGSEEKREETKEASSKKQGNILDNFCVEMIMHSLNDHYHKRNLNYKYNSLRRQATRDIPLYQDQATKIRRVYLRLCDAITRKNKPLANEMLMHYKDLILKENLIPKLLKFALDTQDIDMVALVFRHHNDHPLLYAARHGDYELAKFLIKNKADVNVLSEQDDNPLHTAIKTKQDWSFIKLIALSGLNVNTPDRHGKSVFHLAVKHLHHDTDRLMDLCRFFVQLDAYYTAVDENGCSVLHEILLSDMDNPHTAIEMIKLAIWHEVPINGRDNEGRTCLLYPQRFSSVFHVLLDHGADIYARCNAGFGVLNWALLNAPSSEASNMTNMVIERGLKVQSDMLFGPINPRIVQCFVQNHQCDVAMVNEDGETALHYQLKKMEKGFYPKDENSYAVLETLEAFISNGSDLNARTRCDLSVVDYSAKYASPQVTKYLLHFIRKKEEQKQRAIHYAAITGNFKHAYALDTRMRMPYHTDFPNFN